MSKIEWTERTWNPVRGCSRVSPGCDNCYAMNMAHRFSGAGKPYEGLTTIRRGKVDWTGVARFVPEMLDLPLRTKKPTTWFVNSMSDLFHHSVSDEQIDKVFGVMWACLYLGRDPMPGHVFQVLTKRAERLPEYFSKDRRAAWARAAAMYGGGIDPDGVHDQVMFHKGPHPRIWLGVSAEDQKRADERWDHLSRVDAAVRFISMEPLLGPITMRHWATLPDWVIVGGESGPGARISNLAHHREIIEQCRAAGVPVFHKQAGSIAIDTDWSGLAPLNIKHRKGGDPAEWEEDLRVREFPNVTGSPEAAE